MTATDTTAEGATGHERCDECGGVLPEPRIELFESTCRKCVDSFRSPDEMEIDRLNERIKELEAENARYRELVGEAAWWI